MRSFNNNWNTIRTKKKKNKRYVKKKKIVKKDININIQNNIYIYKNRFDISEKQTKVQEIKDENSNSKFEKGKDLLKNILYFPDSPVDF